MKINAYQDDYETFSVENIELNKNSFFIDLSISGSMKKHAARSIHALNRSHDLYIQTNLYDYKKIHQILIDTFTPFSFSESAMSSQRYYLDMNQYDISCYEAVPDDAYSEFIGKIVWNGFNCSTKRHAIMQNIENRKMQKYGIDMKLYDKNAVMLYKIIKI